MEVVESLRNIPLNFKIEQKFLGLDVDTVFYNKDSSEVIGVLEIHGYQHFLRNTTILTGDAHLKRKILKNALGENYFEIEIYNWELLDISNKEEFLRMLLSRVIIQEDKGS